MLALGSRFRSFTHPQEFRNVPKPCSEERPRSARKRRVYCIKKAVSFPMRKSKFSEHQIIAILKAVEAGRTVKDVCREHEISDATYYQWKSKYGGMQASDIKRLRELEDENRRLKQISAYLLLENRALKDVIAKKL